MISNPKILNFFSFSFKDNYAFLSGKIPIGSFMTKTNWFFNSTELDIIFDLKIYRFSFYVDPNVKTTINDHNFDWNDYGFFVSSFSGISAFSFLEKELTLNDLNFS